MHASLIKTSWHVRDERRKIPPGGPLRRGGVGRRTWGPTPLRSDPTFSMATWGPTPLRSDPKLHTCQRM